MRQLNAETVQNWHGLFQQGTNFMDGTDSVTQCPIVANDSYIYDFNVPSQVSRVTLTSDELGHRRFTLGWHILVPFHRIDAVL